MGFLVEEPTPKKGSAVEWFDYYRKKDIIRRIFTRLAQEMPQQISYHRLQHSLDVLYWAMVFAVTSGMSFEERELLALGASGHDAGYLFKIERNEDLGAALVVDEMRRSGQYSQEACDIVREAIMDTQGVNCNGIFVQRPKTRLGKYLCDADMHTLGLPNFIAYTVSLMYELRIPADEEAQFLRNTLLLMEVHEWHTATAYICFDNQKMNNMQYLRSIIER